MAGKKSKGEIEAIRGEVRSLTEAVWALREQVSFNGAAAAAVASPTRAITGADANGEPGNVTIGGAVVAPGAGVSMQWDVDVPIETMLADDTTGAVRLFAAIGHRQRLALLTSLIANPSTVADLVATLDLGTTGAAYHHLNVLQAAGLVTQAQRGIFSVPPAQAAVVISILAGTHVALATVVSPLNAG
jgi:DNA gyrase subunit B